jgi:Fe-S cluster assembly protein SufD
VRVPRERRIEAPLTLVHHAGAPGTFACTRTLVVVEEGAEASLVEEFDSPAAGDGLLNAVTEIVLEPGARLVHTTVNTLGNRVRAGVVQRARLGAGASLVSVSVSLGAAIFKLEASAELAGPGAHSEVLGAVFGTGRQHLDDHFFQDHVAPRTRSDLLVRVALLERARASYTGRLRIAVDAPGSEAHQENRNLLLSEAARADSIPELEILTHEVQCSHAAATGPVDPAQLFFLRSRGIAAAEAERLIVLGHLEPVFARIPGEAFAAAVRSLAARRLGGE